LKKSLVSLTTRQDTILRSISKELEIPLSELVRRAVDNYIEFLIKEGTMERWGLDKTSFKVKKSVEK